MHKAPKSGDFEDQNYVGHSSDPFSSCSNAKEENAVWLRETSSVLQTIFLLIYIVCNQLDIAVPLPGSTIINQPWYKYMD